MIRIQCMHCQEKMNLDYEVIPKKGKCPFCRAMLDFSAFAGRDAKEVRREAKDVQQQSLEETIPAPPISEEIPMGIALPAGDTPVGQAVVSAPNVSTETGRRQLKLDRTSSGSQAGSENLYASPSVSRRSVSTLNVPAHAEPYVESIRKGSCVPNYLICCGLMILLLVLGGIFARTSPSADAALVVFGLVGLVSLVISIFAIVFACKIEHRFWSIVQLGDRPVDPAPQLMCALMFVPLANIYVMYTNCFCFADAYRDMLEDCGIDGPSINVDGFKRLGICYFCAFIPVVNFIVLPFLLYFSVTQLLAVHRLLNYFKSRV